MSLNPDIVKDIQQYLQRFEDRHTAILPSLCLVQSQFGYVAAEQMTQLAEVIGVQPAEVEAIATFYDMLHLRPMGKYPLRMCANVSCSLLGARKLCRDLHKYLGIREGEVTDDQLFSITKVECLGACEMAPLLQIGREYFEKMSEEKLKKLVDGLRSGKTPEELAKK